jgi:hypothetical protein
MTAEPHQSPVTDAVRSLEMRWIFPGQLETAVSRWFGRFAARTESREDTYLLDPQLPGLSVKVRGGGALEVKAYRGSLGILDLPGGARGHLESWHKWSFPFSPLRPGSGDPPGWLPVRKRRRISRFSRASAQIVARTGGRWASRRPAPPACSVANSRRPPRSYSPSPCPAGWNPARMSPGPMRSGWASGSAANSDAGASRLSLRRRFENGPASCPRGPVTHEAGLDYFRRVAGAGSSPRWKRRVGGDRHLRPRNHRVRIQEGRHNKEGLHNKEGVDELSGD